MTLFYERFETGQLFVNDNNYHGKRLNLEPRCLSRIIYCMRCGSVQVWARNSASAVDSRKRLYFMQRKKCAPVKICSEPVVFMT